MHNLNASPFLIKEREGILQKPFACQNLSLPNFTFVRIFWMVKEVRNNTMFNLSLILYRKGKIARLLQTRPRLGFRCNLDEPLCVSLVENRSNVIVKIICSGKLILTAQIGSGGLHKFLYHLLHSIYHSELKMLLVSISDQTVDLLKIQIRSLSSLSNMLGTTLSTQQVYI